MRLIVKGKVQGVFYRASAKEEAKALGLRGWVRNTPEGHVEAVATGEHQALSQFIDWCKKGPPSAQVTVVDIIPEELTQFERFSVLK